MNWRERQAAPGPRPRFFFASVVPHFADAETGAKIDGLPAPDQKWKLVWPRKGRGHTFRYKPERPYTRRERELYCQRMKANVDHPVTA